MKVKKFFDQFEEIVGAIMFVAIFAILVAQIVSRQVFNAPLIWSEELAKVLFIYVGMLGVSIGIKTDQHVMIDFLYNKFSPKTTKIVFTIIQIIVFISLVTMVFLGYRLFMRKKMFEMIALKISAGWMYASLPTIGTLMLVRYFQTMKRHYRSGKFIFAPAKMIENDEFVTIEKDEKLDDAVEVEV